jgi:hypothetical protein
MSIKLDVFSSLYSIRGPVRVVGPGWPVWLTESMLLRFELHWIFSGMKEASKQ